MSFSLKTLVRSASCYSTSKLTCVIVCLFRKRDERLRKVVEARVKDEEEKLKMRREKNNKVGEGLGRRHGNLKVKF